MKPHRYIEFSDLKVDIVLLKPCSSGLCVPEKSFYATLYAYVSMWLKNVMYYVCGYKKIAIYSSTK
jgi:hypothetical protein